MTYNDIHDFDFDLPASLIAQYPLSKRSASRLLAVDVSRQHIMHQQFSDILGWVGPGDLMVFNDTKVIPARLFGRKASGGKIECLIERILSGHQALAHIRASKSPKVGSQIELSDAFTATVIERRDALFLLHIPEPLSWLSLLEQYGRIPLPPYITRSDGLADKERYQTVYATQPGAVAAPTAGLHFDSDLLAALREKGVEFANVTLHTGAGTFQPVRVTNLDQHQMHSEWMVLCEKTCRAIQACRARGGRIIAVGTTVARCLETAAGQGDLQPYTGETRLFIRPGFTFRCINALLTNFHLPKSTLLMLVSAFAGYDLTQHAYQTAIAHQYRFFSYGDAMFLHNTCVHDMLGNHKLMGDFLI